MKRSKKGLKQAAIVTPIDDEEFILTIPDPDTRTAVLHGKAFVQWNWDNIYRSVFFPRQHNRIDLKPHLNRYKPAKAKK